MERVEASPKQGPLWVSIISVALIVAAVIGALAATQRLTFSIFGSPVANVLSSRLSIATDASAGILAPQGASFSPDGAYIAVVGVYTPCQQASSELPRCGHGLAIYDGRTGDIIQVSPIEPIIGVTTPPDASTPTHGSDGYVALTSLGWSPDSASFALIYTVFDTPTPTSPDFMLDSGLMLINPLSGVTRIVRGDSGYFSAFGAAAGAHPVWRLDNGAETLDVAPAPGIIYAWGRDGLPYATQPVRSSLDTLPPTAGSRYPVGQPDGAPPFTLWQPGTLIGGGSAGVGADQSVFVATFPTWSAKGDHLGLLTVGATLPTPIRAQAAISANSGVSAPTVDLPAMLPAIPPRDSALTHLQEAVGEYGWADIAWNPTGTALASVVCFAQRGQTLEVRDTASGAVIGSAALNLAKSDPGCRDNANANLRLMWSPDGQRLLVSDRDAAALTIWTARIPS